MTIATISPTRRLYNRSIVATSNKIIRVLIIAPTPALRVGLHAMLADSSFEVVGELSSVEQDDARDESHEGIPPVDVFVVADFDQLAHLAGRLADDRSHAIVALTDDRRALKALRALPLHGWSVVAPGASAEELKAALRSATQGFVALPVKMASELLDMRSEAASQAQPEVVELEQPLTPRELEVLELVSRGLPSKLIARELDVTESTIKFHLSSIYTKLNVASRTEAVSRAAKLGLITL